MIAAAVYASHQAGLPLKGNGKPADLPGVALGWRLLFHLERAAALVGTLGIIAVILWRAAHGDLPIKLGQLEYAKKEQAEELRATTAQALRAARDALVTEKAARQALESRIDALERER